MAKVVLIHSSIGFYNEDGVVADQTSNPPMGLLYIASFLEKDGISVRLIDPHPERLSLNQVLSEIKKEDPIVIGISSMTPGIRTAVRLAKAIKKKFKKKYPIGIGGIHPSVDLDFIKRYPIFDFQVSGEGEITFSKIVKDILKGRKPKKMYSGELIKNLDDLPFPARHLLKGDYFCPHDKNQAKDPEVTIISSRGCPFHCIFCSKPAYRDQYRYRSAKNIVDEMELAYDLCGGKFNFVDDTMGTNRLKAIEFCDEMIKRGLKVKFAAQMRATDANDILFKKLAQAGCREAFFGVESGSVRIRNEVIKKMVPENKLYETVKLCRKYGIQSNYYLMLGFPTETWKDINDTINVGVKTKVDFVGLHITQIIPGSELYNRAIKEGKMSSKLLDKYIKGELGENFFDVFPKYIPDGMKIEDLERARTIAYRKFFINPGWIIRRLVSYPKHFDRFLRDCRTFFLGLYVLVYGHTKSAAS